MVLNVPTPRTFLFAQRDGRNQHPPRGVSEAGPHPNPQPYRDTSTGCTYRDPCMCTLSRNLCRVEDGGVNLFPSSQRNLWEASLLHQKASTRVTTFPLRIFPLEKDFDKNALKARSVVLNFPKRAGDVGHSGYQPPARHRNPRDSSHLLPFVRDQSRRDARQALVRPP